MVDTSRRGERTTSEGFILFGDGVRVASERGKSEEDVRGRRSSSGDAKLVGEDTSSRRKGRRKVGRRMKGCYGRWEVCYREGREGLGSISSELLSSRGKEDQRTRKEGGEEEGNRRASGVKKGQGQGMFC